MTEIEKELERFIVSGKATTKVNSGGFQTTHIDPLKIAKYFAQWQREEMTKGTIEGNKIILEPKKISLTKETVIKILELYRSIHRDILKKIEDCDNTDVVDMGDEYVAEEIVKRYLKECISKRSEI